MGDKAWKEGERQVARHMGNLWGVKFYRSEGSGSVATLRQNSLPESVVHALTGDVICDPYDSALHPTIKFPFSIEVKTRKDPIDVFEICRQGKKSELFQWWQQASRDAMRVRKLPLLWIKVIRRQWYVGMDTRLLEMICSQEDYFPEVANSKTINGLMDCAWHARWEIADGHWLKMSVLTSDFFLTIGREGLEKAALELVLPIYDWNPKEQT